jgi:hypothetical protein
MKTGKGGEMIKSKQKFEVPSFRDCPTHIQPTVLKDGFELVGILNAVQPAGDGLVHVSLASLERLVSDELEGKLKRLVGSRVSILRVGDFWGAVKVPGVV